MIAAWLFNIVAPPDQSFADYAKYILFASATQVWEQKSDAGTRPKAWLEPSILQRQDAPSACNRLRHNAAVLLT